ncbi:MAG: hypothetical protein ACXWF8_04015 [Methylobacter sp.]
MKDDALNNDEYAANEAEILRLWDELPDYAKTQKVLDKIKAKCPPSIIEQLERRGKIQPLIDVGDNDSDSDD